METPVHCKGSSTTRSLPVAPKDKDSITQKNGGIYRYTSDGLQSDEEYIEESARIFGGKVKGIFQGIFHIYDHSNTTGPPYQFGQLLHFG